jgi:hypothetical protein
VKAAIGNNTAHIEKRRGSQDEAIAYCRKEDETTVAGTVVEWGTRKVNEAGKRTDLEVFIGEARSGTPLSDIIFLHPEVASRSLSWCKEICNIIQKRTAPVWRDVLVVFIWGVTGTGKTRRIMQEYPDLYKADQGGPGERLWFCGYGGEETLLIDDFYGDNSCITLPVLLNLLDGHKIRLNVKNGHAWAAWKRVFITSNQSPWTLYRNVESLTLEAYKRRFSVVWHHVSPWGPHLPLDHIGPDDEVVTYKDLGSQWLRRLEPEAVPVVETTAALDMLPLTVRSWEDDPLGFFTAMGDSSNAAVGPRSIPHMVMPDGWEVA